MSTNKLTPIHNPQMIATPQIELGELTPKPEPVQVVKPSAGGFNGRRAVLWTSIAIGTAALVYAVMQTLQSKPYNFLLQDFSSTNDAGKIRVQLNECMESTEGTGLLHNYQQSLKSEKCSSYVKEHWPKFLNDHNQVLGLVNECWDKDSTLCHAIRRDFATSVSGNNILNIYDIVRKCLNQGGKNCEGLVERGYPVLLQNIPVMAEILSKAKGGKGSQLHHGEGMVVSLCRNSKVHTRACLTAIAQHNAHFATETLEQVGSVCIENDRPGCDQIIGVIDKRYQQNVKTLDKNHEGASLTQVVFMKKCLHKPVIGGCSNLVKTVFNQAHLADIVITARECIGSVHETCKEWVRETIKGFPHNLTPQFVIKCKQKNDTNCLKTFQETKPQLLTEGLDGSTFIRYALMK